MADETPEEETPVALPPETHLYQIRFASGRGQQVSGESAEEVRRWAVAYWGTDDEITSLEPLD